MPKKKIAKQNGHNGHANLRAHLRERMPKISEELLTKIEETWDDLDPAGQELVLISFGPLDDPSEWMTEEEIHREVARRRGGLVE
jgi:hypothetical protein